jgi:hypothetical protein
VGSIVGSTIGLPVGTGVLGDDVGCKENESVACEMTEDLQKYLKEYNAYKSYRNRHSRRI